MKRIKEKIKEIKVQTGISLTPCDYFTGIRKHNDKEYFNVIITESVWASKEYKELLNICKKGVISKVEANGHRRLAIFF